MGDIGVHNNELSLFETNTFDLCRQGLDFNVAGTLYGIHDFYRIMAMKGHIEALPLFKIICHHLRMAVMFGS